MMVIAYQSSEFFSKICLVSLCSLIENNLNEDDIYVYILSKDFSYESLENVKGLLKKFGFNRDNVEIINISNLKDRFDLTFDDYEGKWGIDSFCKLLLGKLLPSSVKRVLYLDSDTVVCENLHDFYHMNLDNYAVAAVKDFISKEYYDYFGLTDEEDVYCNSGVMLFNLYNWRRMGIEQSISNYLKEKKGFVLR